MAEAYDRMLQGKIMLAKIQIFDQAIYYWNSGRELDSTPPTLQEM